MTRVRGASGRFARKADAVLPPPTFIESVAMDVRRSAKSEMVRDAVMGALGDRRHRDAWSNERTGLGTDRDKGTHAEFSRRGTLARDTLETLHDESDIVHRIVNLPAHEMTREGIDLSVGGTDDDQGVARAALDVLEEIDARGAFKRGIAMARLMRGSAVVLGLDDRDLSGVSTSPFSRPVNIDDLREVLWLEVYGGLHEIDIERIETNTARRGYGKPSAYKIKTSGWSKHTASLPLGTIVDASRVIRFRGIPATRRRMQHNFGWDQSVVELVYETVRGFDTAFDSAAHLMTDLSQAVFTIKGLSSLLAADESGLVLQRLALLDQYRSTVRAIPVDEGESFKRETSGGIEGAAKLLEALEHRLSMATDIPVSILMGRSPAGLNATGESDVRMFYDRIRAAQEMDLRPAYNQLVKLIFLAKNGPTGGRLPPTWQVTFRPLWQMSETEKLELRAKQAEVDRVYFDIGAATAEQIAAVRFNDGEWTTTAPDVSEPEVDDEDITTGGNTVEAYGAEWAVISGTGALVAIWPTAEKARAHLATLDDTSEPRLDDESSAEIRRQVEAILQAINTSALGDRIVAAVGKGLVEEGRAAMAAAGSDEPFDVNTKGVNEYIRAVRQRATEMNKTTSDVVRRAAVKAKESGDMALILEAVESRMRAVERMSEHEARLLINFVRAEAARQAKKRKTWNAVMDSRTRPQHKRLHSKTIGARATFNIGGDRADAPGGFSQPENSINCRCWLTFAAKKDDRDYLDEALGLEERARRLAPTFGEEIAEETARQLSAVRALT